MEETVEAAYDILTVLGWAGLGAAIGLLVSILVSVVAAVVSRRHSAFRLFSRSVRFAQRILLMAFGAGSAVLATTSEFVSPVGEPTWRSVFQHGFVITLILLGANVLIAGLKGAEAAALDYHKEDSTSQHGRRVRTQMQMIRRLGVALVIICAIAGVLLTFPAFSQIGTALFTSAGVLSIVAGLAAQSSLGNLFAGVQIAFTDALRVDDVVNVEGNFGSVEELTLTYVVVRTWDDRRIIVPSTYFTTTAFENWTRHEAKLLGTVFFDLDFMAPVKAMRVELLRIVEASAAWDGRTAGLQITEATGGRIEVRAVVSAASSGQLWDLRCEVREKLIEWIQTEVPYAMTRTRIEPEPTAAPPETERASFIEDVEREWEHEKELARGQFEDTLETIRAVNSGAPAREPILARRTREAELRRDRKAAKKDPRKLADHGPVPALPSSGATQMMSASELAALIAEDRPTAESHLFSGSPEADERGKRLTGPSRRTMAEREEAARRRAEGAQASVDEHGATAMLEELDDDQELELTARELKEIEDED